MTLLSGAAAALTVSYLLQPVLTRLYTPEEFGIFDTFIAVLALFVPFSSAKFEDAIVLPKKDEEAGHLLTLSLALILAVTTIIAAVLYFVPAVSTSLDASIGKWVLLLPLALLLIRTSMLGELWSIRSKKFGRISGVNVARTTAANVVKIASSSTGMAGLFVGYITGFAIAIFIYAKGIFEAVALSLRNHPLSGMKRVARRYKDFPRFTLPASVLGSLVGRLPFLLLLYFFTPEIVGLFGRAFATIMVPLSVVGTAVASVFLVFAAERRDTPLLASSTKRVFDRLVLFGLFPVITVMIAGPQLFSVIFGANWIQAGEFARIIGFWLFLSAVASPLTRLFDVLERQRLEFLIAALLFVLQTTALVIGGRTGSVTTALLYLAIAGSIGRLLQLGILFKISDVNIGGCIRTVASYTLRCVPGIVIILASTLQDDFRITLLAAVTGAAIYGALSFGEILEAFEKRIDTETDPEADSELTKE